MFSTHPTSALGPTLAVALSLLLVSSAAPADDSDLVIHAGGAVEFSISQDWTLSEVPVGREVRLYLTRGPLPKKLAALGDGAWLAFHARSASGQLPEGELAELLTARMREAAGTTVTPSPPRKTNVGGHPGLRGRYRYSDDKTTIVHHGAVWLIPVEGGLFELHVVAPQDEFAERMRQVERILATLKLRPPKRTRPSADRGDVSTILGSWKALHSRLQLHDDGRVEIRFDRKGNYALDQRGTPTFDANLTVLRGRYRSQDDLLKVTWSDGSRTNYRWKREGVDLFLTDHTGRVSQLRRVY